MESCEIIEHIVAALHSTAEFRAGYHALLMVEDRYDICRRHTEAAETALG